MKTDSEPVYPNTVPANDNDIPLPPPTSLRLFYTDRGNEVEISVLQPSFYTCRRHDNGEYIKLHKSQIHLAKQ